MFWARQGCPEYEEYYSRLEEQCIKSDGFDEMSAVKRVGEIQDIIACCETFNFLSQTGRKDACDAVRAVYMECPEKKPSRKEISRRVVKFSLNKPASVRTVYNWLRLAMQTFAEYRALRRE